MMIKHGRDKRRLQSGPARRALGLACITSCLGINFECMCHLILTACSFPGSVAFQFSRCWCAAGTVAFTTLHVLSNA